MTPLPELHEGELTVDCDTSLRERETQELYQGYRVGLDALYQELSRTLDRATAHNVLGCAHGTVNKFQQAKKPIEADLITLVAVSIALRADSACEEMKCRWYDQNKVGVNSRKSRDAKLIMSLPFSSELQETQKLGDLANFF